MTRLQRNLALSLALAVSLLTPRPSLADEPSAADKETARDYLIEGRKKLEKKDYQGALKSLKAAHTIMNVPTTGLDYARALEGLGQLIEARAVVLAVARLPPRSGEPEAFADARVAAGALAERLATRIASVVVTVKGLPPGIEPTLTLDGVSLPAATLGLPRKVDPGAHVVAASAPGFTTVEKRVELRDAATVAVELGFQAATATPAPRSRPSETGEPSLGGPASAPRTGPARTARPLLVLPPAEASAPRRPPTWAWISGGLGVVALGAGVGFAVDYLNVRSQVTTACPGDVCQGHLPAQLSHWNRDLGLSIGLGAVGVAALTTALVGAVSKPATMGGSRTSSATLSPWFALPSSAPASDLVPRHDIGHPGERPRAFPDASSAGLALSGAF